MQRPAGLLLPFGTSRHFGFAVLSGRSHDGFSESHVFRSEAKVLGDRLFHAPPAPTSLTTSPADTAMLGTLPPGEGLLRGGTLATRTGRDLLGRVTTTQTYGGAGSSPGGGHYVARSMSPIPTGTAATNLSYLCEAALPHKLAGTSTFDGPATLQWFDARGKVLGSSAYSVNGSGTYGFLSDTFPQTGQIELSRNRLPLAFRGSCFPQSDGPT